MKTNRLIVYIGIIFMTFSFNSSADDCGEILAGGMYDSYDFSNINSLESMVYQAVCAKKSSSRGGNSAFAFEFPIPELNSIIGLGSSNKYSKRKREEFCGNNINTLSKKSATNLAKKVINKDLVAAWSNCKSSGLKCVGKNINDSNFELSASWRSVAANVPPPVIMNDLVVVGGMCNDIQYLRKNNTINENVSIVEVCSRSSDDSVFAFLNTSQGPLKCYVPKIVRVKQLKSREFLSACADGNKDGCSGLKKQILSQNQKAMDYIMAWQPTEAPEKYRKGRALGNIKVASDSTISFINDLERLCEIHGATTNICLKKRHDVYLSIDKFNSYTNNIMAGNH